MRNTPAVVDTTTNDIIYEPLARSDDYLPFSILASRFDGFLLTHQYILIMISAHDLANAHEVYCTIACMHILVVTLVHACSSFMTCNNHPANSYIQCV